MEKEFQINGTEVLPGQKEVVKLQVARLPSGTRINIQVHIFRSGNPGPCMLVLAGVHGDEINSVEIVRRSIDMGLYDNLVCGDVIVIPLLNIYGFINFSRDTHDGKDVNRNFPGNMRGSLTSRVAGTLTRKILPFVDFGLDFHTGGGSRYNYPQIRYTPDHEPSKLLAHSFGAPFVIGKRPIVKSLRKVALGNDIPMIVFEGGESLRLDGLSIQKGLEGLQRVMKASDMLESAPPAKNSVFIEKTSWLRASRSGLFEWIRKSGNEVYPGDILGYIRDPYGQSEIKVICKRKGVIIAHNNAPVVSQGDALFHIGYNAS